MKKATWKLSAAMAAGLVLLLAGSGRADDSVPPCWRGTPGTTYQNWAFAVSNNPAAPDAFTNPNGTPQATFTQGSFSTGWKASALGLTGLWDLGVAGQVSLAAPNSGGAPNSWKYVQVQVTYFDAPGFYVAPVTSIAGATLISSQTISNLTFGPGVWRTQSTLWLLQPSPLSETVTVAGDPSYGLVLDQIIIDTRTPVPGAGEVAGFPPCWRGQPGSTFQQWMFGAPTSPAGITPEFATNSFGSPTAILVLGPFSSGYIEEQPFLGCRQGIWDLGQSGTMTLSIPNNPSGSGTSYKYVSVEVTQYRDSLYNADAAVAIAGGTLLSQQEQTVESTFFGGEWRVQRTLWRLGPPSPGSEDVVLTGGSNGSLVDQVVVDTLSLDFSCPGDILASADPGQCSKTNVTWVLPAVDGCVVTNVTSTPANGSTFAVGTNLVSALIQDGEGGSESCNFQVVITDNEPPTMTCPANLTVPKDPTQCGAVVNFTPTASDNCSGVTVTSVPASGSLFALGLTTVTCTAHDGAGNSSAPCTFNVRVVDISGDVLAYQPCWRGQPDSTFQQWAFSVSNNPAAVTAELVTNSFGTPQASIVTGPFSAGYIDQDSFLGCRQGIWDLGQNGTMSLVVPNNPSASATSYKYAVVQVTQYRDSILYTANAAVAIAGGTLVSQQQQTVETTTFGGQWVVEQTLWRLGPPSPASESIVLTGGSNGSLIDQVVVDTLSLDFACPGDILAGADLGQCSKTNVTWVLPTVDGCLVTNVVSVPASGSTFLVGTNLVTALIQDGEGGSKSCNFQVVITDNEPPTVACPANLMVPKDPSQCGAVVNFIPTASDNCSGVTVTSVPPSGSLFPLGVTTVTCTAHDGAGNSSAPCTFDVRVVDFSGDVVGNRPCWRGQPDSTFQQWAFSVSNNPAAVSAELVTNSFGTPQASILPGPFSAGYIDQDSFLGCRQGIWDLGQHGTLTLGIPNNPSVSGPSYKYVVVQVTQYRDAILYTANASVAIAAGVLVSSQQQTVETTSFGGQWVVARTLWRLGQPSPASENVVLTGGSNGSLIDQVVVDTLSLDFACPTDILASADLGQCSKSNVTWVLPAVDGCVVTNVSSIPMNGSTFLVGTNLVSALIQDGEGGSKSCNFQVVVTDDEAPVARCQSITVSLNGAGQATLSGADVDNGSSDNCGIASLGVSPNSFTCANLGPNPVVLTVTDVHGHTATCGATVTVVDTTPPSFANCPGNIVVGSSTNNPASCMQFVNWTEPTASDNCTVTNLTADHHPGDSFPVGTTTVTYMAKDSSGNPNTCSFTVTVVDDTPPSIACPGDITVPSDPGVCGAVVSYATPVGTDNCPGAITTQIAGLASGSLFPAGSTTNTFQVTDAASQTATCSFVVTVSASADLSVSVTSSANPAPLGTNLLYTMTVSNGGPCTASGVVLSNYLSAGQVGFTVTNGAGLGQGCPFPGPAAWWPADGNASDVAGANNGTVAGGVTFVSGQVGQTFEFDGLSGSVTVPDAPSLRPSSLTIEGWIKANDVTGVHVVIGKRLGAGTADSYSIWIGSGVLFAAMADNTGSGPFLSYPEFPTSSLFSGSDLVNLQSFAFTLQANADPVSQFLVASFSAPTVALLTAYGGGADPALARALLTNLNSIIQSGSTYTPSRFSGVTLSAESSYILGRGPSGSDLVRLNRFLIRDAYPGDFASTVFPQLTQYFHVAYTFDAAAQSQALYVNGELVNATLVGKTIAYDNHPVLLGADDNGGSPGFFYQGNIDELTIYDRALTGTEVRAIAQAGSDGKCPTAGLVQLGALASGATAQVSVVATPVTCQPATAASTVSSSTADPNLANNTAAVTVPVQDLAPADLTLSLERVSVNNNLLRLSWPLTCSPFVLESTPSVNSPIVWSPAGLPALIMGNLNSTIIPATNTLEVFRVRLP